MNIVDVFLLLMIVLGAWSGWRRGFILASTDLLGWAGSLLIAFFSYQYFAAFIDKHVASLGVWTFPLAFLLIAFASRTILSFFFSALLNRAPASASVSSLNHTFGLVPGLIKGFIYAAIVAALLLATPFSNSITNKTRDSRLAGLMSSQVEWLDDQLSPIFDRAVNKTMNKLVVAPEAEETIKLKFKVTDAKPRPDLERKMLELVNEERQRNNLSPLIADTALAEVARLHSQDMLAKGYFSHISPDGDDPFDRMRKAHIRFLTAGENLAFAATLGIAHRGLMESPGHRENILRPSFGKVGIGILDAGRYGLMISQEFKN